MYAHYGTYIKRDGTKIPYLLGEFDGKMVIKWDKDDGSVGHLRVPIRYNRKWIWKLTRTGISCISLRGLFEHFEKYDAYANATFRHFSEVE